MFRTSFWFSIIHATRLQPAFSADWLQKNLHGAKVLTDSLRVPERHFQRIRFSSNCATTPGTSRSMSCGQGRRQWRHHGCIFFLGHGPTQWNSSPNLPWFDCTRLGSTVDIYKSSPWRRIPAVRWVAGARYRLVCCCTVRGEKHAEGSREHYLGWPGTESWLPTLGRKGRPAYRGTRLAAMIRSYSEGGLKSLVPDGLEEENGCMRGGSRMTATSGNPMERGMRLSAEVTSAILSSGPCSLDHSSTPEMICRPIFSGMDKSMTSCKSSWRCWNGHDSGAGGINEVAESRWRSRLHGPLFFRLASRGIVTWLCICTDRRVPAGGSWLGPLIFHDLALRRARWSSKSGLGAAEDCTNPRCLQGYPFAACSAA